jgi:hypothetical protein
MLHFKLIFKHFLGHSKHIILYRYARKVRVLRTMCNLDVSLIQFPVTDGTILHTAVTGQCVIWMYR